MPEDPGKYLRKIFNSCDKIRDLLLEMGEDDFLASPDTQDAVIAQLVVIGEAVKNVPGEVRMGDPYIEWDELEKLPEQLAAGRAGVDLKFVWGRATNEAYELREFVKDAEAEEEPAGG